MAIKAGENTLMDQLAAFIERWTKEADYFVRGAMFESPVGDMNRASAAVVRRMLADLRTSNPLPPALVSEAPREPKWVTAARELLRRTRRTRLIKTGGAVHLLEMALADYDAAVSASRTPTTPTAD